MIPSLAVGNANSSYFHIVSTIDLQATTSSLDSRVTVLEETGGDDGNSSVAELEVRVETLEGTVADHETRISATEVDVNGKNFLILIFFTFLVGRCRSLMTFSERVWP